ncbi:Uncharacterised protein [Mycobacterium tuberculosis]|nr:Uncharacterised protein [Mycobacterium tuberculosis]CPA81689.1 Uncharacterised protein [Mycobacterium tuberculosis]
MHAQAPSAAARTSLRSAAPWSRESRLYRCPSAIAAGPRKSGSSAYTGHAE